MSSGHTWQSFNLNPTPPQIDQKKSDDQRIRVDPARGVWKGNYLSVGPNAQSSNFIVKYRIVYPTAEQYIYVYSWKGQMLVIT